MKLRELQSTDLRLLRHTDRLGIWHDCRSKTADRSRIQKQLTRNDILEAHAYHESTQQRWTPGCRYRELLPIVYKRLAEEWGDLRNARRVRRRTGDPWTIGQPFRTLRKRFTISRQHYKLVILSNVDNVKLSRPAIRKLQVEFDAVYTAQDVGSYKPADRNFEYMLEHLRRLGIERHEILHTAESMFHDHVPGKRHGLSLMLDLSAARSKRVRRHDEPR